MLEHILIAVIAAVPATVAAGAAWRGANKVGKKVATSNGHTAGQMIEASYELTRSVSRRQDEMAKALEVHIQDQSAHCEEQSDHYIDNKGKDK